MPRRLDSGGETKARRATGPRTGAARARSCTSVAALIDTNILAPEIARREAEELLLMFDVLYPNEAVVRTALRGAAAYQLSWFDAHVWAHAEHYGLAELYSEDFQHERLYGSVRCI